MFKIGENPFIYKGTNKEKCEPTRYRGITLTSVMSKLFKN